jgi:hypothetical protein
MGLAALSDRATSTRGIGKYDASGTRAAIR